MRRIAEGNDHEADHDRVRIARRSHAGLGGPDEDRRGGFERGGWQIPLSDEEVGTFLNDVYAPMIIGQGTRLFADTGPDVALDLADTRTTASGVTIQVFRPSGRPEYATSTAKAIWRQG
jgi:hypothetical protein